MYQSYLSGLHLNLAGDIHGFHGDLGCADSFDSPVSQSLASLVADVQTGVGGIPIFVGTSIVGVQRVFSGVICPQTECVMQ